MLSREFCIALEHQITYAFQNEINKHLKNLWCDGITLPENEININHDYIKRKSEVKMKAWFGENGQEVYKLILKLGKESKAKILNNEEIIDCIPKIKEDWIFLNIENKTLEIKLN